MEELPYQPKFEDGIDVMIYDGPGGQGERWLPVEIPYKAWELGYLLFDLMMKGHTIRIIRKEDTGILYSVTIPGSDREMSSWDYLRKYHPERLSGDIEKAK